MMLFVISVTKEVVQFVRALHAFVEQTYAESPRSAASLSAETTEKLVTST